MFIFLRANMYYPILNVYYPWSMIYYKSNVYYLNLRLIIINIRFIILTRACFCSRACLKKRNLMGISWNKVWSSQYKKIEREVDRIYMEMDREENIFILMIKMSFNNLKYTQSQSPSNNSNGHVSINMDHIYQHGAKTY